MTSSRLLDGDCQFCCVATTENETEIILSVRRLSGFGFKTCLKPVRRWFKTVCSLLS